MTTRSTGPPPPPRTRASSPAFHAQAQAARRAQTKRNVMDTLLGENNLSAFEAGGNDPYNATGRQFRR